ncbi:unknown [Ruminococcus sp. CAG:579]|nr:unknown [Ruminococcus sp. CAG:579]
MPTTGIFTALAVCQTILTATGNTAGPESPPTLFLSIGRRVFMSMRIPSSVLISESASAPAASTALAMSVMLVTFGESFTISGLSGSSFFTAAVTAAATLQSVPKAAPPCFTFGQLMFSSTISTAEGFISEASSAHSSIEAPAMFAIMRVSLVSRLGSS